MVSFNALGFESMTGEPNSWQPRVSMEGLLPRRRTVDISKNDRGLAAAFHYVDQQRDRESLDWQVMIREKIEAEERETQEGLYRTMAHEPDPSDEHLAMKLKRAERRERDLRFKQREREF